MTREEVIKVHHAVFSPTDGENSAYKYIVRKDVFNHLSVGSRISGNMLNAYLAVISSSARVFIGETDEESTQSVTQE